MRKKTEITAPVPSGNGAATHNNNHVAGVLRLDDGDWRVPVALAEAGEGEENGIMPGGVVIAVVILAISYITIMAWFVSQMPDK